MTPEQPQSQPDEQSGRKTKENDKERSMGLFGRKNKKKADLARKVVATYSLQYMLVCGRMPSREKLAEWMSKLEGLSEMEILELGSDMEACKRLLR